MKHINAQSKRRDDSLVPFAANTLAPGNFNFLSLAHFWNLCNQFKIRREVLGVDYDDVLGLDLQRWKRRRR